MALSSGKIPLGLLESAVLRRSGAPSRKIVTPPEPGVDFAAVKVPGGFMVVSADPVTGVSDKIGAYAVRVSANDVATSGAKPEFAESVILLPEGASAGYLRRISGEIHRAAKESGIAIVGGHTEVTPGLNKPIVVMTVFGFAKRFVTSAGAKPGDVILMTKTAGIEGTSELAREHDFRGSVSARTLARARNMIRRIDVTGEALAAFRTGLVHGMHDCTEGGVLGAAYEMSVASGLGFRLEESKVPVARETRLVCESLSADPLRLIGSGSLLVAAPRSAAEAVEKEIGSICEVTRVGRFTRRGRVLVRQDGTEQTVREAPVDELWRVLSQT